MRDSPMYSFLQQLNLALMMLIFLGLMKYSYYVLFSSSHELSLILVYTLLVVAIVSRELVKVERIIT